MAIEPLLLLFDIDGTLVRAATEAHTRALREALRSVHQIDPDRVHDPIQPAGRTDGEIARLILLAAGVSADRIDARADAVRERCCRIYAESVEEDLSHTVVAGIPELLAELAPRADLRLGLLTGNFEPVARIKLARAGVGRWFAGRPGAFGSDSEDRTMLPAIARRRAGAAARPHPRDRTVVIGDTPRDIACARADGVHCLAVSTGPHPPAELSAADGVADNPQALGELLQAWL